VSSSPGRADAQVRPGQTRSDDPIPGVDVIVRKKPSGVPLHVRTDGAGSFSLDDLAPGEYAIEIDGSSLEPQLTRPAGRVRRTPILRRRS